jgi:hypothetical protein
MSLIIETGSGIRNANAYVDSAYVTNYLTARNRQTENGWSTSSSVIQNAAIIAATDYIDKRFGHKFKGISKIVFEEIYAEAKLTFNGNPISGEDLILGDDTYFFVSSLSGNSYEILIGASASITASNFEAAINGATGAGILYASETPQSRHASALASGAIVTLTAKAPGSSGSLSVLSGPLTNVIITSFSGGKDGGAQSLCWPRSEAYDQNGTEILGIPDRLKQAVSEYAVRAVSQVLLPDPTIDPYAGRVNQRTETVGPITESVKYDSGTVGSVIFTPYPSADKLLRPLLLGSGNGGVIRG